MAQGLRKNAPTIMISSTVYGAQDLLSRVETVLTNFGYNVWISHGGTLPAYSDYSAFENCMRAVENCDLFLGIITQNYGSGRDGDKISITHQELLKAIELNKPRWFLAHDNVVTARALLRQLGYDTAEKRASLPFKPSGVLSDLRVIDMYEAATMHEVEFKDRYGNWVQPYKGEEEALKFTSAQFYRLQEVEQFLKENLQNRRAVIKRVWESQPW